MYQRPPLPIGLGVSRGGGGGRGGLFAVPPPANTREKQHWEYHSTLSTLLEESVLFLHVYVWWEAWCMPNRTATSLQEGKFPWKAKNQPEPCFANWPAAALTTWGEKKAIMLLSWDTAAVAWGWFLLRSLNFKAHHWFRGCQKHTSLATPGSSEIRRTLLEGQHTCSSDDYMQCWWLLWTLGGIPPNNHNERAALVYHLTINISRNMLFPYWILSF